MITVAPSILSADFACLLQEVQKMETAGADWLHIDVMDGHFVPNITVGPLIVKALQGRTRLLLDVHLMVEQPDLFLNAFCSAGAGSLTVHAETCPHLHRVVHNIKEKGIPAGVALNPATPLSVLEYLLPDLDLVLIMSVNPGFAGQEFLPAVLPKIRVLAEEKKKRNLPFLIQVDGGINEKTSKEVIAAGAEVLVAGSALFQHANPAALIDTFKRITPGERKV